MVERRGGASDPGIADENVELAVAFMQRRAEPCDAVEVGQIERHQGRSSAVLADLVVEFFEAALRSRHRNNVRAGFGQRTRGGVANAARGAGDESDTGGEGEGGHRSSSARASSLRTQGPIRRDGYDTGRRSCLILSRRRPAVMGPCVPGTTQRGVISSPPPAATIAAAA